MLDFKAYLEAPIRLFWCKDSFLIYFPGFFCALICDCKILTSPLFFQTSSDAKSSLRYKMLHWQLIERHDVSPLHSNVCVFSLLVYPFSNFGQMPKKKRIKQACLEFFEKIMIFLSRKTSTFLKIGNFRISKNIDFPKNREFQKFHYNHV